MFSKVTSSFFILITCLLLLQACHSQKELSASDESLLLFDSTNNHLGEDNIDKLIGPYRLELESEMNQVIGYSESRLEKNRPEGRLGNLAADMLLWKARSIDPEIKLALLNHGGLRAPLPAGPLTRSSIFQLMPFDNELVVLSFDSTTFSALAQTIIKKNGDPIAGCSLSFGVPANFECIDLTYPVKVATSDYLAKGGDSYTVLQKAQSYQSSGILVRDIFLEYVSTNSSKDNPIKVELGGRIK